MAVTYIKDLDATRPDGSVDYVYDLDNYLREVKSVLKNTFPNLDGAVTLTPAQFNATGYMTYTDPVLNITATQLTHVGNTVWTAGNHPTTISGYGITDAYTKTETENLISTTAPGTHNHALNSLSDVSVSGLASGNVLQWSGTEWNPAAIMTSLANDTNPTLSNDLNISTSNIYSGAAGWIITNSSNNLKFTHGLMSQTISPTSIELIYDTGIGGYTQFKLQSDGTILLSATDSAAKVDVDGYLVLEPQFSIPYPAVSNTLYNWGNNLYWNGTKLNAPTFASITSKPTTLSGYGITDAYTKTQVDSLILGVSNDLPLHTHPWTDITGTPTTISGYGITNAYTKTEVDTALSGKSNTGHTHDDRYYTESEVDTLLSGKASTSHNHTLDSLSNMTIGTKSTNDTIVWNGSAWVNTPLSAGSMSNVVDDTTPQLGGDLDLNGKHIVETTPYFSYFLGDTSNHLRLSAETIADNNTYSDIILSPGDHLGITHQDYRTSGVHKTQSYSLDNNTVQITSQYSDVNAPYSVGSPRNDSMSFIMSGTHVNFLYQGTHRDDAQVVSFVPFKIAADGLNNNFIEFLGNTGAPASTTNRLYELNGTLYWGDTALSGAIPDHGLLSGLEDDDHPQYLTQGRADGLYTALSTFQSHSHTLNDLSDVAIGGTVTDQVLKWNGTQWVNAAVPTNFLLSMDPAPTLGANLNVSNKTITTTSTQLTIQAPSTAGLIIRQLGTTQTPFIQMTTGGALHFLANKNDNSQKNELIFDGGVVSLTGSGTDAVFKLNGSYIDLGYLGGTNSSDKGYIKFSSSGAPTDTTNALYRDGTGLYFNGSAISGGGVTHHGDLTGLGDDDHTQYHTDARGDARYSQLGHIHGLGDVSGLITELDAKSDVGHHHATNEITNLDTILASKSDTTHTHDDRYYTETEVNSLLSGKADTDHDHAISDVTGLQTALDGKKSTTPQVGTATYASPTTTIDVTGKDVVRLTLTGNTAIDFTGGVDGQKFILELSQDATGSRTVTWSSGVRFGTDITSVTLTATASKTDRIGFIYNSAAAKYDVLSYVRGF